MQSIDKANMLVIKAIKIINSGRGNLLVLLNIFHDNRFLGNGFDQGGLPLGILVILF